MLKEVSCMTTSLLAIYSFYDSVSISPEHLKRSICQGHCIYFTALVVAIDYEKRSVFDSRKFEEYVCLGKIIVALSI